MKLYSTRDNGICMNAASAVITGIAPGGGLFVPREFPQVTAEEIASYGNMSYAQISARVLGKFFDEFSYDELLAITTDAYASFDSPDAAPLTGLSQNYILELWHGPTIAFKDMALTVLPRLLTAGKRAMGEEDTTLILVATSGDTGKAALSGFADVPGTMIAVFYPRDGVSAMQKLQMVTQTGENTRVIAVTGNFDDAQTGVKRIFADGGFAQELKAKNICLSSANSINFGRLAPQVAYYFAAYARLLGSGAIAEGERINFCVPTGNFGNILAAWYAKRMGLPVARLICASNVNNVLTDFFMTGEYDRQRPFHKTSSPSMDILISSNLERLIYESMGQDDAAVRALMERLTREGKYTLPQGAFDAVSEDFSAGYADAEKTAGAIERTFEREGYLIDPHTAVAQSVYEEYAARTGDTAKTVVVSTASPYKFCADVLSALSVEVPDDPFDAVFKLNSHTGARIPAAVLNLRDAAVRHTAVTSTEDMKKTLRAIL